MKLLINTSSYRDCPLQVSSMPTTEGIRYWVSWLDADGEWMTDFFDSAESAVAIAKLLINENLAAKIVQFKRKTK